MHRHEQEAFSSSDDSGRQHGERPSYLACKYGDLQCS
jgi:hypothetical protein